MPLFYYKAAGPDGDSLEGEVEARDQSAAAQRLQTMGYVPLRIEEMGAAAMAGRWRGSFGVRRISHADVAVFTREIATLLKAGLPLDRALEITANLAETEEVSELLNQVRNDVRGGSSFHVALESHPIVFSRLYLNMIRAGESSGALDIVMARLTEFMERSQELKETVRSALIYPAILVGVSVLSIVVLLLFVVPQFTQLFEESGRALPLPTQVVIGVGEFIKQDWWVILLVLLGGYTLWNRQMANPSSRFRWDGRFLRLPLFGELIAKVETARFSRTLGTLLNNGVSLLPAMTIVKETVGNSAMAETLDDVAFQLREGAGLGKPLMETGVFPRMAVHMVMVGEETGRLAEMLTQVADVYDREVNMTVKRMLALLEPMLILGLGMVIGGIIMSILVAILSVNELAF